MATDKPAPHAERSIEVMLLLAARYALGAESRPPNQCGFCEADTRTDPHAPWCLARLVGRGRWTTSISRPDTNDATPLWYTSELYIGLVNHAAAALRGCETPAGECVHSLAFEIPQGHKGAAFRREVDAEVKRLREAEPEKRAREALTELRAQFKADLVTRRGYEHFYMLLCARHGTDRINAINRTLEPLP